MPIPKGKNIFPIKLTKLVCVVSIVALQQVALGQYKPADYSNRSEELKALNDGYHNLNPFVNPTSSKLWFTKVGHPENIGRKNDQDIWVSTYDSGKWMKPTNSLPGVNTELNDLIIGRSEGSLLYVLRHEYGNDDHLRTIRAYKESGDKYEIDHEIKLPLLDLKSEFFGFFVAEDESYILVSMKGEISFGKEDLYVMLKKKDSWTKPIPLGARINTIGFEMSPFMAHDDHHLFFASEGHGSYGSADIFVSVRLDDTWQNWSKPINLGPNINSEAFEAYFCLAVGSNDAFFVSNRDGKIGQIYSIKFKESSEKNELSAHTTASGFIRLEKLPTMNVKLNLLDENDQVIQSVTTNEDGYFNLQSFLPDRDYKLVIDDSVRSDLGEADIFLTNDLGDKMVFMNERELGIFGFKVLSGQKVEEVERLEKLASTGKIVDKPTKITGKVATFGTVNSQVTLNVVDENNKVVETIQTDKDGYFSFSTNAQEKSYFLSVDQDLQGLVDVYEIFLTNDNPNEDIVITKTNKHLFEFRSLADGTNAGLKLLAEHDRQMPNTVFDRYGYQPAHTDGELAGYLKLGKLPMINTEIMLIDENDKLLGKAVTDDNGMFVFKDAIGEGDYTLKLEDEQQEKLDESEIYLANNPDEVVIYLNDKRSGVFAFKKLSGTRPMTLYSLRTETESGRVVNENEAKLKGKFEYKKLPKSGVKLKLMDEDENVIQITEVSEDGEFQFEHYIVNRNYFIAVEGGDGLSDIYEIYLSGQQKNVLVNRTNKFVFAFKVLPTQDIVLTRAYESDRGILEYSGNADAEGKSESYDGDYYEFNLNQMDESAYRKLEKIILSHKGEIRLRFSREQTLGDEAVGLLMISDQDVESLEKHLNQFGLNRSQYTLVRNTSDQLILILR
ncbi:MAG: hypothetical protein R2813_11670 [Flavobacteriales bacterium]